MNTLAITQLTQDFFFWLFFFFLFVLFCLEIQKKKEKKKNKKAVPNSFGGISFDVKQTLLF